jgi:DNA-binding GntR family transcriptional regulator
VEQLGDPERRPQTRAEWVESEIRRAILEGRLAAGERLNMTALSETLNVSPTPLREALQRLAGNGLITLSPQRGAYVSELTSTDLGDIYKLRLLLEPKAAEIAAERVTEESRERIRQAHTRLAQTYGASVSDIVAREAAHREFHVAVVANCASPRLLEIVTELLDHSARYRVVARNLLGGRPEVVEEHAAIADAAIAGDRSLVGHLVDEHLNRTYHAAMEYLEGTEHATPGQSAPEAGLTDSPAMV